MTFNKISDEIVEKTEKIRYNKQDLEAIKAKYELELAKINDLLSVF